MELTVNIAYYREEDWGKFLNSIDDRDTQFDTWDEWHEAFLKQRKIIEAQGFKVKKIIVDLDELKLFCRDKGINNTGKARSLFVSNKER